jgi:uncharacterized protein (TIGR03086 family)
MLLDHVSDSIAAIQEAIATGGVGVRPAAGHQGADAVARLRGNAATLLETCAAAGPRKRVVAVGDRELPASMTAVMAAMEVTVHGWDISVASGEGRPIPPGLAAVLLPIAPVLITPGVRPGLFADPVRLPGPAGPGDQLVAFLGRQPRLMTPGLDRPRARHSSFRVSPRRFRGTSRVHMSGPAKRAARNPLRLTEQEQQA